MLLSPKSVTPALVAKTDHRHIDRYLRVTPAGRPDWVDDPGSATSFTSMREATRMASRLLAALRAYGLPRDPELAVHRLH